jgi:NADH-quinone oxidoreductase subunit L
MQLPFTDDTKLLEHWLHPVVEIGEAHLDVETSMKWILAGIAIAGSLAGIALAVAVYLQKRIKPVEPEILLRAWRVDEAIAAAVGGPGRTAAAFAADVIDREGIDGAVNGAGWLARKAGATVRVVQTGYVRTYALGIAAGAVLLLGWFASRTGT